MAINHNLRQLRLDRSMTQEQAAEKIGVTRQTLSSYESGRTRPDIDMLVRLSELYGTDLDGIIYGESRVLQALRRIKTAAGVVFVLLTVLTLISSALLWSGNHFFAISEGQLSPEELVVLASRQKLSKAWELTDGVILTVSLLGFLTLFILLLIEKPPISWKGKLCYSAALSITLLAIAAAFAAADSVYPLANYIVTPCMVMGWLVQLLAAELVIEGILKFRRKRRTESNV